MNAELELDVKRIKDALTTASSLIHGALGQLEQTTVNTPKGGDHALNHDFQDWLSEQTHPWKGEQLEGFVTWSEYTKTMFRAWAIENSIPLERWAAIYREFIED